MSSGIQLLPEQINFWVSFGVFVFFSARSAVGYIKAKRKLQGAIQDQHREIVALGRINIKVEAGNNQ